MMMSKNYWEKIIDAYDKSVVADINKLIKDEEIEVGNLSDGYHTFAELYEFRKVYNAVLFNEWAKQDKYDVHKSRTHYYEETDPMFEGYFIVQAKLPSGLISNHYKEKDWDLFKIPEVEEPKYEHDGHTSDDVIDRLKSLLK